MTIVAISPSSLPASWLFALFLSYLVSRSRSAGLRSLVAALSIAALLLPPALASLPRLQTSSFMFALIPFQLSLFIFYRLISGFQVPLSVPIAVIPRIVHEFIYFIRWIVDAFWFLLPIVRADRESGAAKRADDTSTTNQPQRSVAREIAAAAFDGAWKAAACAIVYPISLSIAAHRPVGIPIFLVRWFEAILFAFSIMGQFWALDLLSAALLALTFGRLRVLILHRSPLLSSSLTDFWSRRWNLLLRNILHETIFNPLRRLNIAPAMAALASFAVSGALHVYLAHLLYGYGELVTMAFFLLNSVAVSLDQQIARMWPKSPAIRVVFLWLFLSICVPLYLSNTEKDQLEYLRLNPVTLPVLSDYTFEWFGTNQLLKTLNTTANTNTGYN